MEKKLKRETKEKFVQPVMYRMEISLEGFCAASNMPTKKKADVKVEEYSEITNEITFG